jgi:hypothetical protein
MGADPASPMIEGSKQMDSILSFLGAILLLFLAGSAIISFICGGILIAFVSLNGHLKAINR